MDLSKLPKMSQTPAPPPPIENPSAPPPIQPQQQYPYPQQQFDYRAYEPKPSFAEAWISIAIGVILLLVSPYIWQWLISKVSNYQPPFLPITDSQTQAIIPYSQSIFFFGHLCVFAFAVVLIVDGLILFTRKPALVMAAFALTVIATLMNFVYVIKATMGGEGLPILSAMAFAFGVYIAFFQWKLVQTARMARQIRDY